MATDIREYITTCSIYQNIAVSRHKPYGKLKSLPVPERLWQKISLNFITQLPRSYIRTAKYDAILIIMDHYTKIAKFIPITTNLIAFKLAAVFHENIKLKYNSPKGIISDQDIRITSKF